MSDSNGSQEPRSRTHLRWDPTVNAGHVFTAVWFVVAVALAYGAIDTRISLVEQTVQGLAERSIETRALMNQAVERLEDKVDQIIAMLLQDRINGD